VTLNALTFDVEDWRQLVRWKMTGERGAPGAEVVEETEWILDTVGRAGVRATFFVLDNVAAAFPELVRRIAAEGHEVGSHGLSHELVYRQTPETFRAETRAARDRLQQVLGTPVAGYRAAEFSVTRRSWWALRVLAEEGFEYDSSVYPIAGRRYGVPDFPLVPTAVDGASPLVEVPLTVVEAAGRRWPAAGGGYFRLAPYAVTRAAIRAVNAAGRGAVAYFHPYEFAGRRLAVRVPAGRRAAMLRYSVVHNLFRRRMRGRLARLLRDFRFGSVREYLQQNGF
jgi:polysaccharide deacetylase family protein (PEP-CTERM system associated)